MSCARTAAALVGTLVAAGLVLAQVSSPVLAHASSFSDVSESNPAHSAIESLASRGIMGATSGDDFAPYSALSRGQATKAIVLWRGLQAGDNLDGLLPAPFSDVGLEDLPYVAIAYAEGWVGGYSDGTFRPDSLLTREQIAVVVVRSLGLKEDALALTDGQVLASLGRFTDRGAISPGAKPYVALAVARGLLSGYTSWLDPLAHVTRAQFALIVTRADALTQNPPRTLDSEAAPDAGSPGDESNAALSGSQRRELAAFMDKRLFRPHQSPVTGEMVLQNADWYGIPPLPQLVILAAETSFGDPDLGGSLARQNNFGCLRYGGPDTPWGQLSDGSVWVAGKDWYSFATPQLGMAAFGRFLKVGVNGYFKPILAAADPDWESFALVYHGKGAGLESYIDRLEYLEGRIREMAAEEGVSF